MCYALGIVCVLALGIMGCSETAGVGGDGGPGGNGVACQDNVCPCTEAGIRAAIAEGGGPFKFDCDGPTVLVIEGELKIDNVVALDGEGNLTIDGNGIVATDGDSVPLIAVVDGATAQFRGFTIIVKSSTNNGREDGLIGNQGTFVLFESSVSTAKVADRRYEGIRNLSGTLTLQGSTVSDVGILSVGTLDRGNLTLVNSTVSSGGLAACGGTIAIVSSTLATDDNGLYFDLNSRDCDGSVAIANSLVEGGCIIASTATEQVVSNGYNIESPGDTCGLDQPTDQVNVSTEDLNLGPLADNGGPTMTHALLTEPTVSEAIDQIPAEDCEVTEDQRGFPRDSVCDVGAFEVQVTDCAGEEIFTPCTIDNEEGQCLLEQCAAFDCSSLEDGTYCEFAVLGDGTTGVCEAGRCTKPEDCTGLVDGWDCIKGEAGSCVDGECVTPP